MRRRPDKSKTKQDNGRSREVAEIANLTSLDADTEFGIQAIVLVLVLVLL